MKTNSTQLLREKLFANGGTERSGATRIESASF